MTNTTLQELLAQQENLAKEIEKLRNDQYKEAVARARSIIEEYDLQAFDIFGKSKKAATTTGNKVAPKYRDPSTGATWTGRGKPPLWISTAPDREALLINTAE